MKARLKKILAMGLVVATVASASIAGTMAYLTKDAGEKNNVFTVGNIDVTLDEEVGVIGEGGEVKEKEDGTGAEYTEVMPGDFLQKEVTLTNNGDHPVYAAVTVTINNGNKINEAIDNFYEDKGKGEAFITDMYNQVFSGWGMNYTHANEYGGDARNTITKGDTVNTDWPENVLKVDYAETMDNYWLYSMGNWFMGTVEKPDRYWVDGPADFANGYYTKNMNPNTLIYTYYLYLPARESSTLFDGLNVPAEFNAAQLEMFNGLQINVKASAIQADNITVADKYVGDAYGEAKTAFEMLAGAEVENTPAVDATVASVEELDAAVKAGADSVYLLAGKYDLPVSLNEKTVTIYGGKEAVITVKNEGEYGCDYAGDGSNITFNGVTIDTGENGGTHPGFARMNATYQNCTINGQYTLYGNSVFNNCTFNVSGDVYSIWTWSAPNAYFVDCTFNSDGKAILLYGGVNTNLVVENCTFNDNGGLTDLKAAIEIGNDYGKSYTLTVNNTTVNGYEINDKGINTGTTLWANKNSMGTDKLDVVVDGVDVY